MENKENKINAAELNDDILDNVSGGELFSAPVEVLKPSDIRAAELNDDILDNVSGGASEAETGSEVILKPTQIER